VLVARGLRIDVEMKRHRLVSGGQVDVQEVDVALRAGMDGGHRERRVRARPRQRQMDRSRVRLRVGQQLGHEHDHFVGRVLSGPVPHAQPELRRLGIRSSFRR
jgi:hypothetical protein